MKAQLGRWMNGLGVKRTAALVLGPGFLALGFDAAVEHLAGRADLVIPAQYTPVLFAPLACVTLLVVGGLKLNAKVFRTALRILGGLAIAVGTVGTGFHIRGLMRLLEDAPVTFLNLEHALAVAPPLFAPAAFAGVGAVLLLLGIERFALRFTLRRPAMPQMRIFTARHAA